MAPPDGEHRRGRLGLRCGIPPRQTQNDNDASGNPQRVAGAPRGRPYRCGITYHDPRLVKKNAPTGARMAPLIGELSAKLTERFLQRPVVHTLIRSTWHGFANGEQRPAVYLGTQMPLCGVRLKVTTTLRETLSA